MAEGVLMPKAGITVEECVITEWLKKPGDQVAVGDILFTYETDKATFECESTAAGTLLEIFYNDGDEVPVLVNVCAIGTPGEDVSALKGGAAEAAPAEAATAAEAAPAPAAAPTAPTGPVAQGVLMPKAGITVEECIITEWLKKVGDQVAVGDILFTYETDKATFECESTAAGTLLEIFYNDGDEVPVLVNVCAVGNPGDSTVGLRSGEEAPAAALAEATPAASAAPAVAQAPVAAAAVAANPDAKVSPRAKMVAETLGVDPTQADPTGPYGRVIERDVRALAQTQALSPAAAPVAEVAPAKAEAPAAAPVATPAADAPDYVDEKFSAIRKATAKAMVRSLSTMAQLTHQHSFDASTILNLRKQLKANGEAMGMPNITINDLVMFAVSRVILNHPQLNATMPEENMIRKYNNVHLGMAVDTPKGLMVPTIFNANKLSLAELSIEAKRLAKICQEGKATPDMLSGASFTVSNVGSLGVEVFTPVVNPPQVGILGVCGTTTRIKEVNGEIKTYPGMNLCLSYDHRALDGTPASKFMKELCQALENFSLLMMK
ncbi:MAG: 2-oxo acid dehydrogenase subunit E2 [Tyzzerella sp.]|nr:2-oxo acid dehydrogenase subunit E2 [Tyzzerella sp.]